MKKLLTVKSIVTLALTICFIIEVLKGQTEIENIYLMIIAFYFGTQTERKNQND